MEKNNTEFREIDNKRIEKCIGKTAKIESSQIRHILEKARSLQGLDFEDIGALTGVSDPELLHELFETARWVKSEVYGQRLVVFAPLYISSLCRNECTYCAFRAKNTTLKRKALNQKEIEQETIALIEQGHKRVLMVAGESYPEEGFSYVLNAVDAVYSARVGDNGIRRVNVNVAPLSVGEFKELGQRRIGTYQLFQETYHQETYSSVHLRGRKSDYKWRIGAIDRAMEAGIDDVGIGVLFGLFDWRYEILAMMQHIKHLENKFGVGPHTISVPRLEPATGSDLSAHPPAAVSDVQFRKIVAILRLAVPYTGIIMSTRETAKVRRESFALGVSQISAGSKANPGGYKNGEEDAGGQFSLGDHRSLAEVLKDIASLGYVPSFCTGCYRLGRTGKDFMDLARPGDIKHHCGPNAVSTYAEYLMDYADSDAKQEGFVNIERVIQNMEEIPRDIATKLVKRVKEGKRDVYC